MRLLIQRVKEASVYIDGSFYSSIGSGLLVFFGAKVGDEEREVEPLAQKLVDLRIFKDNQDKMNLAINDVDGEVLVVSQFTLYGDTSSSRRPSFTLCAKPDDANKLYERFIFALRPLVKKVATGVFGAKMEIHLINDGPVTFIVETSLH